MFPKHIFENLITKKRNYPHDYIRVNRKYNIIYIVIRVNWSFKQRVADLIETPSAGYAAWLGVPVFV